MVRYITKVQDTDSEGSSTNTRYRVYEEETSYCKWSPLPRRPPTDYLGYCSFQTEKFFSRKNPFRYERPVWDLVSIASRGLAHRFLGTKS